MDLESIKLFLIEIAFKDKKEAIISINRLIKKHKISKDDLYDLMNEGLTYWDERIKYYYNLHPRIEGQSVKIPLFVETSQKYSGDFGKDEIYHLKKIIRTCFKTRIQKVSFNEYLNISGFTQEIINKVGILNNTENANTLLLQRNYLLKKKLVKYRKDCRLQNNEFNKYSKEQFILLFLEDELNDTIPKWLSEAKANDNRLEEIEVTKYRNAVKDYIEKIRIIEIIPQQDKTKTDKLKAELSKHGFFELPKVNQLSELNRQSLIELISTNNLPYSIAMFDYLDFIKHLKAEYLPINDKLFIEISKWFSVNDRAVKGNINVLNKISKEDRTRYTADKQKQTVQKDYEKLK